MFGPEKTPAGSIPPPPDEAQPSGKGRPTPTRKQAEAANKRPLVPADRKAAGKEAKQARREQRDREYRAMATGDEANMPAQHRGPVRRYIRDAVDTRRSMAQYFLPVALVLLVVGMAASGPLATMSQQAALIATGMILLPYLYLVISVIDTVMMWRRLKFELTTKFGSERAGSRGNLSYFVVRIYQMRRLRQPKPQIGYGAQPR